MTKARRTFRPESRLEAASLVMVLTIAITPPAMAYIGPGAGFALVSSVGVLLLTVLLALLSLLLWPLRSLWGVALRGRRARPWVRRLIVVGFDGQDAALTERFMAEGKLPNFSRLAEMGCYSRLRSTYPSITPVAWSTFSTGTGPGRHGIFDFLERDRRSYLPLLSSVQIDKVERSLKIGRWRLPLRKPAIRLLRKSKSYWKVLAEHRIWSTILRMPVSFPPERFRGAQLSAMCTPDLLGTQGTFLLYTTRPVHERIQEGGIRIGLPRVQGEPHRYETVIQGPDNAFREGNPPLEMSLRIAADRAGQRTRIGIDGDDFELVTGRLSPWVSLRFRAAPGVTVSGLCRMLVSEADEEFSLYVSPINIDPERPAMPISHPPYYAGYLAKMIGPYSTLGLAEDTWALNEGVIDDATFL
ncbi:MAG: alkaline phosphatase family protein, partial [Gammaproteobacteria bacterium]|nr:alkaline phosphatase family protein [Gammaproteobacteria bacterium]